MTVDVMAHSMVYWVRDLFHAGLFADGSRIFAMTSRGRGEGRPDLRAGERRQGRPRVALPAAGAGADPARHHGQLHPGRRHRHARLRRIPGHEELRDFAAERNPGGRLTTPEDVAEAIVALASPRLHWMTGNTIGVDGGELMGTRQIGVKES